jgi:4-hydroxy-3-methylbut-2-en-1-yl diphosphate reductase
MKIIRAKSLGMCFGVRDAISMAIERAERGRLTIYGDLVHNETVVSSLRERGIQIQRNAAAVQTKEVMITAHGASERTLAQLRERGLSVLEATCPLVHHAHRALQLLVRENYFPVVIGQRGHVEVRGLTEDLREYALISSEEDVNSLPERPRIGIVAQTTQPLEKVRRLVGLVRERFPSSAVRFEDTVCQPTKQRQAAAIDLAQTADVVVVVGGAQSNNTRELVATCGRFCSRVHHVQSANDLRADWFEGTETVGLTAGTSTPDGTIDAVEQWLRELSRARAEELDAAPCFHSARENAVAA